MKDILTIVFRLTMACLLAGIVMGATFIVTDKAKKHNEHANEHKVMLELLGYSAAHPPPETLAMHRLYRYVISKESNLTMGYLLPMDTTGDFTFVTIDLDGKFLASYPLALSPEDATNAEQRDKALLAALGQGISLRLTDQTIVVTNGGKRVAYLLPGKFPGFKTFISVLLALESDFSIRGLEIMEHEEDPGLGGEIVQAYFKNQFQGKSLETTSKLDVSKLPLPDDYFSVLDPGRRSKLEADEAARIQELYRDKDIYALSGATISSKAVTSGVKGVVRKFTYRIAILDRILAERQITAAF